MIRELILNENLEEDVYRPVEGFPHMCCYEEVALRPGDLCRGTGTRM